MITCAGAGRVLALGIVASTILLPVTGARAGTPERAEQLLLEARQVAAHGTFVGIVEVRWRDDTGAEQSQRIVAQGVEGSFVVGIGAKSSHGHGDERTTEGGDGAETHTQGADGFGSLPAPGAAWDLEVVGRRRVAHRPAVVIAARDDEGRARAKYAVDRATGQLLRRAVLDRNGRVVRSVAFVAILTVPEGVAEPPPDGAEPATSASPRPIEAVPAGFVERDEISDSYRLLGRYEQPDGSVQQYYSDGLFTLSVFQTEGRVDWDALAPAEPARVDGLRSRAYATASGTIVVWGQRGLVLTVIGDGPRDRVMAAVADLSGRAEDGSWLDDAVDFVLGPFDWS